MIKTLEFKGKSFQIEYVETYATHPTWYSFEDEKDVREAFWNPKEGDIVLDVGACCGSYTLPALAHGANVWAWAPGKLHEGTREFEILWANVNVNGWNDSMMILDSGLYDKAGYLNVDTQEFREHNPMIVNEPCRDTEIRVRPLDELVRGQTLDTQLWIKIDVEGAEVNVLRGAINTIRKFKPKILVECHLFHRPTIGQEVQTFLLDEVGGYKLSGAIPHPASNVCHAFFEPL